MMTTRIAQRIHLRRRAGWLGALIAPLALMVALIPDHSVAGGQAGPSDDDAQTRKDQHEMAGRVMRDNCLICHTEEIISSQRLTPPQWKAEVEKMVGWGSPLPAEQVASVVDWLAGSYPATAPPRIPARIGYDEALAQVRPAFPAGVPPEGDVEQGGKLYTTQCATCHGANAQGSDLGPNLVETSVLLRPADYHEVVRRGKRRMPGFQILLKPAQESDVLAWLRAQRFHPVEPK